MQKAQKIIVTEQDPQYIGKMVKKVSDLPFLSGLRKATIKGYTINPYTGRLAFTFEEDDSFVECFRCTLL